MTREEHEKRVEQLRQEFAEAFSECFDCSILDFAPGWYEIIEATIRSGFLSLGDRFRIRQVKEKFGLLRIYSNADIDLLDEAEDESASCCMFCGDAAASIERQGWISTLCSKCIELTDQGGRMETHFEALTTPAKKH